MKGIIEIDGGKYALTEEAGRMTIMRHAAAWPEGQAELEASELAQALAQEVQLLHARPTLTPPESTISESESDPAMLWAEIYRLRTEIAGPAGHLSWKAAALHERRLRAGGQ